MIFGLPLLSLVIWTPILAGVLVLLTGSDRNAPLARWLAATGRSLCARAGRTSSLLPSSERVSPVEPVGNPVRNRYRHFRTRCSTSEEGFGRTSGQGGRARGQLAADGSLTITLYAPPPPGR